MRQGFTTGSCAAAAAKAAAYMLLTGKRKETITIETPKGILYEAEIKDVYKSETKVSCGVEKDGGDDPDVTTGLLIYASVSYAAEKGVFIDGGNGVGQVTKPGLDQPVGNAAINHVPREMITKEVLDVCEAVDYQGGLFVEISAPGGEQVAEKTFNPRLGIVGGISILGTSGVVEPMSTQAILDTIRVELSQRKALGYDYVAITPGNYGQDFIRKTYGYDLDKSVKCSNFIGQTIDMAVELGFQKLLLAGHLGKLVKVAGGIMNTHSREADCRMEILAALAVKHGVEIEIIRQMLECVTTEEAVRILRETGKMDVIMQEVVNRICYYLDKRAGGRLSIDCELYVNEFGELARSKGVEEWFILLEQDAEHRI